LWRGVLSSSPLLQYLLQQLVDPLAHFGTWWYPLHGVRSFLPFRVDDGQLGSRHCTSRRLFLQDYIDITQSPAQEYQGGGFR
jgi:hypothetical protein